MLSVWVGHVFAMLTLVTTIIGLTATPPSLSLSVRENTIPNSDSLERADENGSENEQANTVSSPEHRLKACQVKKWMKMMWYT